MWIVMVSMVSGCLMYTVLVANATAMIANIDPAAKEYKSKVLSGDTILHQKIQLTYKQQSWHWLNIKLYIILVYLNCFNLI